MNSGNSSSARSAAGIHSTGAWRYPGAWPDANSISRASSSDPETGGRQVRRLLHGRSPRRAEQCRSTRSRQPNGRRSAVNAVSALAGHRTYRADRDGIDDVRRALSCRRRFASLEHISAGARDEIVTTSNPDAALNFGLDDHMEHAERYKRGANSMTWSPPLDSLAMTLRARRRGRALFDPAKMQRARSQGKYLSCADPSTSPAPSRAGR